MKLSEQMQQDLPELYGDPNRNHEVSHAYILHLISQIKQLEDENIELKHQILLAQTNAHIALQQMELVDQNLRTGG